MKFWKWFINTWTIGYWFILFLVSGIAFGALLSISMTDRRYLVFMILPFISGNFAWYKRWVK